MKKVIVLSAIALGFIVFSSNSAQAQVSFGVNINIGSAPVWNAGPPAANYYYIPDADCYYSVREKVYVYRSGNRWVRGAHMPGQYRNFDFNNRRVIAIQGQDKPYLHHEQNRAEFARANERYNNQHGQPPHRDDRRGGPRPGDRRDDHRH